MSFAQTRTIGDTQYEVIPLSASASIEVMGRVLGVAGASLRSVASLRDAAAAMGTFLAASLDSIEPAELLYLAKEFAKVTNLVDSANKRPLGPMFDEHFRGRFWDMLAWVRFAAEVTYGPLGEIPGRLTPAGMTAPPPAG